MLPSSESWDYRAVSPQVVVGADQTQGLLTVQALCQRTCVLSTDSNCKAPGCQCRRMVEYVTVCLKPWVQFTTLGNCSFKFYIHTLYKRRLHPNPVHSRDGFAVSVLCDLLYLCFVTLMCLKNTSQLFALCPSIAPASNCRI